MVYPIIISRVTTLTNTVQKGGMAVKIEKISENQIRCTLNSKDLSDRELRLSELAYGSDKANALFHDMIRQASQECNFEPDDQPLMIEAIPVSSDCLVLLVTKCQDADELDTRFSNFTASPADEDEESFPVEPEDRPCADEILNCFDHLTNILGEPLSNKLLGDSTTADKSIQTGEELPGGKAPLIKNLNKTYCFADLEEVITAAKIVNSFYHGENTLYKDPSSKVYYLVVSLSEHTAGEFNKVCNILAEYGRTCRMTPLSIIHFEEHFEIIVRNKATQVLSKM